jgi:hypothetical protein
LDEGWKSDDTLLTLLFAIILFSSQHSEEPNPNLSVSRVYCNLLKRYIETKSGTYCQAREALDRLRGAMDMLRDLKEAFESTRVALPLEFVTAKWYQIPTGTSHGSSHGSIQEVA